MAVTEKDLTYPEIVCPECHGEGYFERMDRLHFDGWNHFTQVPCDECSGNGWVYDDIEDDCYIEPTLKKQIERDL